MESKSERCRIHDIATHVWYEYVRFLQSIQYNTHIMINYFHIPHIDLSLLQELASFKKLLEGKYLKTQTEINSSTNIYLSKVETTKKTAQGTSNNNSKKKSKRKGRFPSRFCRSVVLALIHGLELPVRQAVQARRLIWKAFSSALAQGSPDSEIPRLLCAIPAETLQLLRRFW